MKLYKIDFTNTIGDYMVTVPTDSQFLIGISNGDSEADVELLDGETEITPEADKIGEYTCFRFETSGTPFRKPYRAAISGNNFETKDLWVLWFDEVDYQGYTSVGLGLPENINPEDLNYDNENKPASFQVYVYGLDKSVSPRSSIYLKTITLTWNASKTAYEVPEDFGNNVVKYIKFANCTESYVFLGYGWETGTGGDDEYDAKKTVPSPIPYTQNIDLYIICKKMSVAYRDFEGNGGGTFSPCVIDSTTSVVQVTPDNLATIERTIYTASVDAEDYTISKSVTFDIDEDAFTAAGVNCNNAVWEFKVLFEIPVVEEGVLPGDWSETTAPNLVSFRTKNGENLGNLGGVSLLFGDGEMELVTQYLVVPSEVTKRVGITIRLFRSFDAFDDNLCARLFYLAHDI